MCLAPTTIHSCVFRLSLKVGSIFGAVFETQNASRFATFYRFVTPQTFNIPSQYVTLHVTNDRFGALPPYACALAQTSGVASVIANNRIRKWSAAAARAAVAARGASARARAARCWWTTASGHRMYNFGLRCIKLSLLDLDSRTPIPGSYVFSLKSLDRRSAPSRLAGPSWHAGRPGRASCRKPPAPPDQGLVLVLAES